MTDMTAKDLASFVLGVIESAKIVMDRTDIHRSVKYDMLEEMAEKVAAKEADYLNSGFDADDIHDLHNSWVE